MTDASSCRMYRTSSHAVAVVLALSLLGLGACERDRTEQTSQTTTTSAELPAVDRSHVAVPMGAVVKSAEPREATEPSVYLGEIDAPPAGASRDAPAQPARAPNLNPATPDMSGVGPGHIWYVPGGDTGDTAKGKRPGTGEPNSSGSHNIGSGASPP